MTAKQVAPSINGQSFCCPHCVALAQQTWHMLLSRRIGQNKTPLRPTKATLVKGGFDPRAQKALDIVGVIGNESVHPGQIDLRDDPDTALELFKLVNLVAEIMISSPKHVDAMYSGLPAGKREAIERRDRGGQ